MESLLKDLKHSFRMFLRNPSFTLTALLALALGIGTNTAIFSVINQVLLKPLAAPDPGKIVTLGSVRANGPLIGGSPTRFNLWREQSNLFQDVSAYRYGSMNLTGVATPELIQFGQVSADYFRLFGIAIAQGRSFTAAEDLPNAGNFAILSDSISKRLFAGRSPLGKTISLSDRPYTVVGITAAGVETESAQPIDIWIPFQIDPASIDQNHYFSVAARIRPGVTPGIITAQLQRATDEFRRRFPGVSTTVPDTTFVAEPILDVLDRKIRPSLLVLAVAVSFVLLIACANVANLLLLRAAGRKREIATRIAVGASRARIVRQLLAESVALSLVGGILGLILGMIGIRALLAINPGNIPRIGQHGSAVTVDWRVISFTLLVSFITGILFGLIPAFQSSRIELSAVPRKNTVRALLVMSEVSIALILLIGSGLLIRSFVSMRSVDPGFNTHNVLTVEMSLTGEQFQKTAGLARLVESSLTRIRALPGVEDAAAACCLPIGSAPNAPFVIVGRPLTGSFHARANMPTVSASYFDVFKIPLLRGRQFTERDIAGSPRVAIVSQSMARQFWPNADAIGAQISLGRKTSTPALPLEIVGIVGDLRERTDRNADPAGNTIYIPLPQTADDFTAYIVRNPTVWMIRTRVEPHTLLSAAKNELVQASGGLPTMKAQTMDEILSNSTAREDFNTLLMLIFGASALLMAAIGLYGLMAHTVQQRTREMGIRMALGAKAKEVRTMVVLQAIRLTLMGIAIGLVAAWNLTRFIESFLFDVKPLDPIAFVSAPILLSTVALLAAWLPALRASHVNPMDALRHE